MDWWMRWKQPSIGCQLIDRTENREFRIAAGVKLTQIGVEDSGWARVRF